MNNQQDRKSSAGTIHTVTQHQLVWTRLGPAVRMLVAVAALHDKKRKPVGAVVKNASPIIQWRLRAHKHCWR
jgi:hypothetical protein